MTDIQQLSHRIFRYACNLTQHRAMAEDITQETILRAIEANQLSTHSPEAMFDKEENSNPPAISWYFRVARNLWLDRLKSADYRKTAEFPGMEVTDSVLPTSLELKEDIEIAMKSMMQLPNTQRQVLYLRAVEELSIDQISESLEISKSSVKANLSLARKKMRESVSRTTDV